MSGREMSCDASRKEVLHVKPNLFVPAENLNSELKALKKENALLQKYLQASFEVCLQENKDLAHENHVLKTALDYEKANIKNKIGSLVYSSASSWHRPISLPFRLLSLWFKEANTPNSLSGEGYAQVISTFKEGGFEKVKELFSAKKASNVAIANAYTALARELINQQKFKEAAEAAKRAYEAHPNYYRLKWYAFRLYQAGQIKDADILLGFLKDKISFSNSEEKQRNIISHRASIEEDLGARAALADVIEQISEEGFQKSFASLINSNAVLLDLCETRGWRGCVEAVQSKFGHSPYLCSLKLVQIAYLLKERGADDGFFLAKEAVRIFPSPANIRALFWAAQNSHKFYEALDAYRKYKTLVSDIGTQYDRRMLDKILESETCQLGVLDLLDDIVPEKPNKPIKDRICYVLHNSLPISSGGYAIRSHGMAQGLKSQGYEVICLTRPGYPLDIALDFEVSELPLLDEIEGVQYQRLFKPVRLGFSYLDYMSKAADRLVDKFKELKPEIVIAASNYVTGLPALIAAKRLGLPFIYEVRGLWEITRASREDSYKDSVSFNVVKLLESKTCEHSDHVLALTNGLKEELRRRGVAENKITVIPNACDSEKFHPLEKDVQLLKKYDIPLNIPVIGYIGTFVGYEGLDLLVKAGVKLKKRGKEFRLMLVGNENVSSRDAGPITREIKRLAQEGNLTDWLIMPGRVPHGEVIKHYSLIDIAPFPRLPLEVCELVSPLKPMEAMSMGKAVVVSSVAALAEMVKDSQTGLIFKKGDVDDLADKLEGLLDSPEKRTLLGQNARKFVKRERNWKQVCGDAQKLFDKVLKKSSIGNEFE